MFCCSGERPRKRGVRFAKGLNIIIYMVIDLKVLVRSFNYERRVCYIGNPRENCFFEFAKVKFYFANISLKLGIIIIICKGLLLIATWGPGGEGYQRMRVTVAKFPKVRLCESQILRPLVFAFPLVHPLLMARVCELGYFRESYAKERVKVKVYIGGGGLVNFGKKFILKRDSVILVACLKGYQEVICDSLV